MFLDRFRLRRSIVLTWLFSYMAVLLLPVLISIIVYNESSKTLESEIHQANDSLLKQVREVMDNQFQMMERLSFEITWNIRVQDLLYSNKHLLQNEHRYDLFQITQDLKLYKSSYPNIDQFYFYYPSDDMLLLPSVTRNSKLGYELMHQGGSLSYEQWKRVLDQKEFRGFISMPLINDNAQLRKGIAYVSTYVTDPDQKPLGTNVVMLDESRILGSISNMQGLKEAQVMILNKDNEVLVSSSSEGLPAEFPYALLQGDAQRLDYTKDGEAMQLSYIRSAHSDMKYISVIPSRVFWKKAEHVRNLTYISILISVLGGFILTFFFLRRNYGPVRQILQAFAGKTQITFGRGDNEFHFIQNAIHTTLQEMEQYTHQMKQQHHILRSNFISRLLKGKLDSQVPIDDALTAYDMHLLSDDFAVMLFYVEERGPFYERIQGMETGDKHLLLQFIITNVVEELAAQQHRGYVTEMGETFACLINFQTGQEEERGAELLRIAKESQAFLLQTYHIHLTLSISGVHSAFTGISQAYLEALEAMEYKLVMGSAEILSYPMLHEEEPQAGYHYPIATEQQLMNALKIGDMDKAKQIIDDVFARNFAKPSLSIPLARCLMFDLTSTMIKAIYEIGDAEDSYLLRNPKGIERLVSCETVMEMQLQLTEMLERVCRYTSDKRQQNIQQARQQTLNGLVTEVTRFVEQHYADVNLNISMIGDHLDMKPTYVSKLFKDQTGGGLLDYINKIRIDKAKVLIGEYQRSVTEVSTLVGFNDPNAFIRTFKKYEGITPGKYKEMLQA
jgi:two-component system response regulator YesN